jgi:hypothetical protein
MIALIYGGDFNLVRQKVVPFGHEEYDLEILKQQFRYFGPFPENIGQAVSEETAAVILYLMREIPFSQVGLFQRITEKEVCKVDKTFISKIMRMDWRERPTAKELLEDDWFLERFDSI